MRIDILTLAELVGVVCVVAGATIIAGLGGLILGLGVVLLYEAKA